LRTHRPLSESTTRVSGVFKKWSPVPNLRTLIMLVAEAYFAETYFEINSRCESLSNPTHIIGVTVTNA